jgi:hypothetical protein
MRYPLIRSFLRTAIAVGVVSSYQSSSLASCWNELLRPNAGVCYIYDLQSDGFAGSSLSKQEVGSIATAIQSAVHADQACNGFDLCSSESNVVDSSESAVEPVDTSRTDWDDCIAAAKRFEMRSNFDAAWAQIESQASSLIRQSDRLFSAYGQARKLFTSFARNSSVQLVELIRINESLPVTGITTDPIAESLTDCNIPSESDWNCYDLEQPHDQVQAFNASGVFPVRGHANIYVFSYHCAEPLDNTWQEGLDPVCPQIDPSNNACHWADSSEQPRICCPLDTQKQDEPVAESSVSDIPVTADPIRPPTLESDGEQIDPPLDELSYNLATSQPEHWNPWSGQRSFGEGYRAAWLEPTSPIGMFSREDLQYATKFSSELLNNTLNEIDNVSNVEAPSLANDLAPAIETFASTDFLVQRHESTFGTLILPVSNPTQIAVDYAMKHLKGTSDDTRLNATKSLANQVRTVGEFLVDFALQIETEAERVEIARRDSSQR